MFRPKYRPDIDGLRAVAVLAVVAFHAFPGWMTGGFIGVDVFFVISGYLISTIIFESLKRRTFSFSDFYARRIRRVFPAFLVVLIASYAFGWFSLLASEYKQLGKHVAGGAAFISNVVLWSEAGYFDTSAETKPLLHLWSLGIEEQFYIVWPLSLWLAWKRKFSLLAVTIVMAVGSFALNVRGATLDLVATFYSPLTRYWELMAGSVLAWLTLHHPPATAHEATPPDGAAPAVSTGPFQTIGRPLANVLSGTGTFLLAAGFWGLDRDYRFPGLWAVVPVLGTVLLIAGRSAWINRFVLSSRPAVWLGIVSYPLYLWHWPLLSFARIIASDFPSRTIRMVAVGLSIGLAWLTHVMVERPVRLRGGARGIVPALAVLMVAVGFIGYTTYVGNGYEFRSLNKDFKNTQSQLVATPETDSDCFQYLGKQTVSFHYCRFTDAGSASTVAVVGDSHAHMAYPGIADYLKRRKVNAVLLANSSCPPLVGVPISGISVTDRLVCSAAIDEILNLVLSHSDIKKVVLLTRGPLYMTGTEPFSGQADVLHGAAVRADDFRRGLQGTIDTLVRGGKRVFYVTENPELTLAPEACLTRPFRRAVKDCRVDRYAVLARQTDYLRIAYGLSNAVVVNGVQAFCPSDKCFVFDEGGSLMYADDDHLSVAGSRFLVRHSLAGVL